MTDISNTINAPGSVTIGAGQVIVAESPETVLSPEIRKAMDIIFPKSTVQLCQGGSSLSDRACLNTEACHEGICTESTAVSASVASDDIMASCATFTTTSTVLGSQSEVLTNTNCASLGHISTLTTSSAVLGSPSEVLTNTGCASLGYISTLTTSSAVLGSPSEVLTNTGCASLGYISTLTTSSAVLGSPSEVLTNTNCASPGHITTTNTGISPSTNVLTQANGNEPSVGLSSLPADPSAGARANNCVSSGHITTLATTHTGISPSTDVLTQANGNEPSVGISSLSADPSDGALANICASSGHITTLATTLATTHIGISPSIDVLTLGNGNKPLVGILSSLSADTLAGALAICCASTGHISTLATTKEVISPSTDVSMRDSGNAPPVGISSSLSADTLAGVLANSSNCASSGHISTLATANTVTGPSIDALTHAIENNSPVRLPPLSSADSKIEPKNTSIESAKKSVVKAKITKADLEIINSCDVFNDESLEKTSRRLHSADLSSSECISRGGSDSEDMRRPFAIIAREKKKQKKRKKKEDSDSVKSSSSSSEINDKISTSLKSVTESRMVSNTPNVYPSNSDSPLSLTDFICDPKNPVQNAGRDSLSYDTVINKFTAGLNNKDSDSQNWVLENGYVVSESFDKHAEIISEEISNISFSSTKENQNRRNSRQKLPKLRSLRFNIVKHKNKITNTFPPCFIVVKKLQIHNFMIDYSCVDNILPLSARLKHLSDLCDRGLVKCKKKKQETGEELIYRNIFEETVIPEIIEDDLDISRRRNLRKRDKNISYVEPSEDDILDEYSRKRHRSKHKDTAVRSEEESVAENKKRKKQHSTLSESNTDTSNIILKPVSVTIAPIQDCSDRTKVTGDAGNGSESSKIKANPHKTKDKDSSNEIIVYPPVSLGSKNYYRVRESAAAKTSIANNLLQTKPTPTGIIQVLPPSTNITILPTTTISGTFMHHPNPVNMLTSLTHSIPGSLPTTTLIAGAPHSSQRSASGGINKQPQYCVVKMDGKDVLLQIVSSGGIGTAVPVVMPKGKALFSPSGQLVTGSPHLFGQPLQQAVSIPSCTQPMPVSQGNIASNASLQPLMGIQVLSRPITTSSHNVSMSALPVLRPAQLTSLTNTTSVRSVNLSSPVQQVSQSSAAGLLTPVNVISALNSGVSITSVASATRNISALPSAVTPMAAPNTTTVARTVRVPSPNLRAVVPNQSTSLRSFRIFVPGCSATGVPSRFATLGTIANSSPLTHMTASSILLPQRKRSSDLEMTPEQRAAKRRKLEKKYPLPPGVVIKTEPLDVPPKPSTVITTISGSRSLLSQNLHLLPASRPGANFQSIRIISPSLASSLSARNLQGNSNIIYRAASIGGGQTILLPTSLAQISTRTATTVMSASVTSSSSLATSSSLTTVASSSGTNANTTTNAANVSGSSVTSVSFSSIGAISENNSSPPVLQSVESTSAASISSSAAGLLETETTSVVVTCSETLTTNGINTISVSQLTSGGDSLHNSGTSTVADNRPLGCSPSLAAAKGPCETLENVKNALEELKQFIQVQEACGLKGVRLEKLKELFQKKEEHYKETLQLAEKDVSVVSTSKTNGDIAAGEESDGALNGHVGSEMDPFVID